MRLETARLLSDGMVLDTVVAEHAVEASFLWDQRRIAVHAPHVSLRALSGLDARLEAHLDGLRVAREAGASVRDGEAPDGPGGLFSAVVAALEARNAALMASLLSTASAAPTLTPGLWSGFGWVSPSMLQGTVRDLLASPAAFSRHAGIACCALHRIAPRASLLTAVHDPDSALRARGIRAAGETGFVELAPICGRAAQSDEADLRFWGAWSSVVLGSMGEALRVLADAATTDGPHRLRAFHLVLQRMEMTAGHEFLQRLTRTADHPRSLILGSGIIGNPDYVPWLIAQAAHDQLARAAGEAFSLITGVDLSGAPLGRAQAPDSFESGPNDDPADPNVAMDPDEGLPWPDPQGISDWWAHNAGRFQRGIRYFMGAPVTREHCIEVLKTGSQRQRILAAQYLCLLEPGTPLFNTSAPAWRQQRLLAQMR